MARTSGDSRLGLQLIGAGLLGAPVMALVMSLQGRTREQFISLAVLAALSVVMGFWLLLRK